MMISAPFHSTTTDVALTNHGMVLSHIVVTMVNSAPFHSTTTDVGLTNHGIVLSHSGEHDEFYTISLYNNRWCSYMIAQSHSGCGKSRQTR